MSREQDLSIEPHPGMQLHTHHWVKKKTKFHTYESSLSILMIPVLTGQCDA